MISFDRIIAFFILPVKGDLTVLLLRSVFPCPFCYCVDISVSAQ